MREFLRRLKVLFCKHKEKLVIDFDFIPAVKGEYIPQTLELYVCEKCGDIQRLSIVNNN